MKTVLHLGYEKCASSTLRNGLFSSAKINGLYLSPATRGTAEHAALAGFFDALMDPMEDSDVLRSAFVGVVEPRLQTGRVNVLSSERILSGTIGEVRERLKILREFFADATILVIIRRQDEFWRSLYDFTRPSQSFAKWWSEMPSQRTSVVDYRLVKDLLNTHWPEQRLVMLPLEDLEARPDVFAGKLARALGLSPQEVRQRLAGVRCNPASAPWNVRKYLRSFFGQIPYGRYIPGPMMSVAGRVLDLFSNCVSVSKTDVPAGVINGCRRLYRDQNMSLNESLDGSLTKYGYDFDANGG